MVDSVLLPVHAQATRVVSCAVSGSILATYIAEDNANVTGDIPPSAPFAPYAIPGVYQEDFSSGSNGSLSIIPQITVTPGVTDNFTLNSVLSGVEPVFCDLSGLAKVIRTGDIWSFVKPARTNSEQELYPVGNKAPGHNISEQRHRYKTGK